MHFFPRGRSCLWFSVTCWGSVTGFGQEGKFEPPQLQLCGRRDGQAGLGGSFPLPRPDRRLGKVFPSLRQAGSSKGWAACKLPLGLSFWLESKAN